MSTTICTENVSGVPEFWLTIFKNVDMLSDMIQEHDEPILKHLQDIKVKFSQSNPMVSSTQDIYWLQGGGVEIKFSACPMIIMTFET